MDLQIYFKQQCDAVRNLLEDKADQQYTQQLMDRHDESLELLIDIVNAPDRSTQLNVIAKAEDYLKIKNKKK